MQIFEQECFISSLQLNIQSNKISYDNFQIEINKSLLGDLIKVKLFKILTLQGDILQKLAACVDMNWLCLLVGDCNSSVKCLIKAIANVTDHKLCIIRLTSETDALELLGTYEQVIFKDLE